MAKGVCHPPYRLPVSGRNQSSSRLTDYSVGLPWLAWGIAAVALYLLVVIVIPPRVPVRILYDGLAPLAPYRWVRPPASHLGGNEPPTGGTGTIEMRASGSEAVSLATDDGQAVLIVPKDGVVLHPGETVADVKFTPLDPEQVGTPLPGRRYDGNAYRIEGVYRSSQAPIALRKPATVVLRYPSEGTEIWQLGDSQWIEVREGAGLVEASLQVYASTSRLGVFVAGAPLVRSRAAAWWAYGLAAIGLVVVIVGILLSRQRESRPGGRRRPPRG